MRGVLSFGGSIRSEVLCSIALIRRDIEIFLSPSYKVKVAQWFVP